MKFVPLCSLKSCATLVMQRIFDPINRSRVIWHWSKVTCENGLILVKIDGFQAIWQAWMYGASMKFITQQYHAIYLMLYNFNVFI